MHLISRRQLLAMAAAFVTVSCHRGPRFMRTTLGVSGML